MIKPKFVAEVYVNMFDMDITEENILILKNILEYCMKCSTETIENTTELKTVFLN